MFFRLHTIATIIFTSPFIPVFTFPLVQDSQIFETGQYPSIVDTNATYAVSVGSELQDQQISEDQLVVQNENSFPIGFSLKSDFLRNMSGGLEKKTVILSNIDLTSEIDLEKNAGIAGSSLFIHFLGNNGKSISNYVGDFQKVSNIEAYSLEKVFEFWVQKNFFDDKISLLFGLFDLNSEFYVTPTSLLFLNSSHGIGIDLGQTGLGGPSIFPNTSLAFRARFSSDNEFSIAAVILDGVPGAPNDHSKFGISLSTRDGLLDVTEFSYERLDEVKYSVGLWFYTGRFVDICSVDGLETYRERKDNFGVYALVDQRVLNESEHSDDGLNIFLRIGWTNHHINLFDSHLGCGFVYNGLIPGRDGDKVGYAVAIAKTGYDFKKLNKFCDKPISENETTHEFTYSANITQWLTLQFDLQYIVKPGANPSIPNAFVSGFRTGINF